MDSIYISTWNVEGKGSPKEIESILSNTSEFKSKQQVPHVLCVQQANLPSNEESLNYKWLCSGKFGSAVLISKASSLKAGSVEQVCEQICVAEVITDHGTVLKVISCYIPPSTDYITKDLWLKLSEIIKTIPCSVTYVVAGDFNAEVGSEEVFPKGVCRGAVGTKLFNKNSNENGIQLKKLVLGLHATIANTFGDFSSNVPMYTYKDGEEKCQRSFIVVPYDRVPFPYKVLTQDSKISFHPGYKSAILSKGLKFTLYEKFVKLISSQVVVSSWNIQGASPSVIDKALSEYELPVVCVQDLFLTSDQDVETKNYTWFTSKKLWGKNVGILIKTSPDISMANFEVLSECLCMGDITLDGNTIKVISCCLPPHADSARFQEVTEKLTDLVKNVPEEKLYVVAGDFNTHVTYTNLNDKLVFDEGDENASFLQKIMNECNMELEYMPKTAVTQASEKIRRNSTHILMSASCMMKYSYRRYVRWVPFFEHGVTILYLPECDVAQDNIQLTSPYPKKGPASEVKGVGKVKLVDGFLYVTRKFCRLKKYLSVFTNEQQAFRFVGAENMAKLKSDEKSDLAVTVLNKYKNTPPPMEELLRILGNGFTLYLGFLQESLLPKTCAGVLSASFEYLKRGTLMAECIDVLEEKTHVPVKRIINFRWNGIVVHQQEGGRFMDYKLIINKGQRDFINKLGQHYFTVRAKASFYNNGLAPLCQDKEKLNQVLRVMKKDDFSPSVTVDDLKKFIGEFFSGDPNFELVFGPDFSYDLILTPIKHYATSKGFGVRCFKSSNDLQHYDNLSIFVNRNPREIRKKLMEIGDHQDLRFQLIPPCGVDNNYQDWIGQWAEKTIPDEYFKLYETNADTTESDTKETTVESSGTTKAANIEEIIKESMGRIKRNVGFVHKNVRITRKQIKHKIVKCTNLMSANPTVKVPKSRRYWINTAREESDLPQEIVDKYCENEIPVKDLSRILGDEFILYFGFGQTSSVSSTNVEILAESFESTNRGGVMAEFIEVDKMNQPFKRMVKFKWNGICIHQEEGPAGGSFKNIYQKGQVALIDKLGRHFDAVKAKMSYYNRGLPPLCKDEEKLNEVLRVVKKSEFSPTAEVDDVKKPKAEIDDMKKPTAEIDDVKKPKAEIDDVKKPTAEIDDVKKPTAEIDDMKKPKAEIDDVKKPTAEIDDVKKPTAEIDDVKKPIAEIDDAKKPTAEIDDVKKPKAEIDDVKKPTAEIDDVKKPTAEIDNVKKFISDFFNEDTHLELVFGPEFSVNEYLEPIKKFAMEKDLGYRWFKSTEDLTDWDNIAVFIKRTPLEIHGRLNKLPENHDLRFFLVPPCEFSNRSHYEWAKYWTSEVCVEEFKLIRKLEDEAQKPTTNQKSVQKPVTQKPSQQLTNSGRKDSSTQPSKTVAKKRRRQQKDRVKENLRSQPSRRPEVQKRRRQPVDHIEEISRSQLSRSERQERSWRDMDYYGGDSYSQPSRSARQEQDMFSRQHMDYYGDSSYSRAYSPDEYEMSRRYREQTHNPERDEYEMSRRYREQTHNPERVGRKRGWEQMDDRREENFDYRPSRSDEYDVSERFREQTHIPEPERYVPQTKRARDQSVVKVDKPRWDDIGPLVIVWPLNIRSENERDSRKVLEANFPTEISLEPNNRVAVYVTLPLRKTRRDKKYCLCIGNGVHNATKQALDLIVKRSSVIKHTANFLPPDGLVPNFIRYNIPCQTNPRSYIMLGWRDTGPLTGEKILELFDSFKFSLNEDLFFDSNDYTHEMKLMLIDMAPRYGLKVRHFGDDQKLINRYVCVYKTRAKDSILEEVLRMRDFHPKYRLVTNKLPPRLGLNIF